jgi:diadenosine tetraphosphatase ApaH/serine/threonine PP2A family protein phosphatase
MRGEALEVLEREFNELADEEVSYLQQLPHPLPVDDRMVLAHGSLTGRDDYILNAAAVKACRELLLETYAGMRFCFFGHTHLPMVICGTSVDTEFRESRTVELDPFANYLVNPGSVGQPRDQCPQASYALFEPEESCLTIRRVEYNIEAEQARMAGAGLPEKLIRRIAVGV